MLYFTIQNRLQDRTGKVSEAAGARWRFHGRILLKSWASRFSGRRSIWWSWRVTLLAPRIGNDVSYVMQIKDAIHFARQAQYLLSLKGDFTCSAHWKWRFICDADHWWHWFCVAGAVFGEVGGWLFAKCCILQYKIVSKIGPGRSPKRRVQDDDFIVGYRRIILESSFYWRRQFREFPLKSWQAQYLVWSWRVRLVAPRIVNDVSYVTPINHEIHFAWQGQFLVNLAGASCCSAYCKWSFICDADQSWHSFLRGRRSIWWSCMVPLVVPRIVNDVSK